MRRLATQLWILCLTPVIFWYVRSVREGYFVNPILLYNLLQDQFLFKEATVQREPMVTWSSPLTGVPSSPAAPRHQQLLCFLEPGGKGQFWEDQQTRGRACRSLKPWCEELVRKCIMKEAMLPVLCTLTKCTNDMCSSNGAGPPVSKTVSHQAFDQEHDSDSV